jgi:hypothetical protein
MGRGTQAISASDMTKGPHMGGPAEAGTVAEQVNPGLCEYTVLVKDG